METLTKQQTQCLKQIANGLLNSDNICTQATLKQLIQMRLIDQPQPLWLPYGKKKSTHIVTIKGRKYL